MQLLRRLGAAFALSLAGAMAYTGAAFAQKPENWQIGMQAAMSPVQADIRNLHSLVTWIAALITIFVGVLILYVIYRFNAKRNPVPSRTSHNTVLEVAWTVIPVLILVVIAIPSFRLVYYEDRTPNADMTIKVTGHQWAWEYTYPDNGDVNFTSNYIHDEDLKPGQLRLLDVDNPLVLPVGKNIRILITSVDVIHSFFIPSFGVQRYAIPGRTIETWVRVDKPGQFYGECNQVCGTNHPFMPISVRTMSPEDFAVWVKDAKTKFAAAPTAPPQAAITAVASAAPARLDVAQQ